jgi:hypothetical protein
MSLSISPCGTRALAVSPDARLSLYHTQDAERRTQTFFERQHLSCAYTSAPSWAPAGAGAGGAAAAAGGGGGGSSLVALGTAAGSVVVWDVARGEVKARLGGPEAAGAPPAASPAAAEGGASGGKGKRRQREGCAGFAAPVRGLWWRQGGSAGGQVLACAEGSGWVQGWELGADGRAAAAAAAGGSSVGVPATAAWRTGEKSGVTRVAGVAAAAEDGASEGLVLAAATGTIAALAGADGKRAAALSALAGHALPVTALAVSSDEVRG